MSCRSLAYDYIRVEIIYVKKYCDVAISGGGPIIKWSAQFRSSSPDLQYHFYHQPSQFGNVVFSQVSFGTKNTNAMRTNANK